MEEKEQRFIALWSRRATLRETEWAELYALVAGVLRNYWPEELRGLHDDRMVYVQDFFLKKVFEPARHDSTIPYGFGALCDWFRRFLRDQLRRGRRRPLEDTSENAWLVAESAAAGDCGCGGDDHELPDAQLGESAKQFLSQLDPYSQAYLALSTCADDDLPISQIAERYRIPSYHRRAAQLGITRKRGEFVRGYEKTLLGRWMAGLGITFDDQGRAGMLRALRHLCTHVLAMRLPGPSEKVAP